MSFIAPHCTREISFPLAKRWIGRGLIHSGTPYGDLVSYRSNIDHMQHYQFIWMPYRGLENVIPQQAYQNSMIWTAKTALICFSIVEWHQTDRVKLQFGLLQEIPDEPENIDTLHCQDMRGNHLENWKDKHAAWIQFWNERRSHCLTGQPIHGHPIPTEEYMVWFRHNSNLYLSALHLLRDPRCGVAEEPTQPSHRQRRNRPRLPTPPVSIENEAPEPHRHSFSFTRTQQQFEPPRQSVQFLSTQQDDHRKSLHSSDQDFVNNIFDAYLGTPESATHYINNMYSFGVPSFPNQVDHTSSMHVDLLSGNVQETYAPVDEENSPPRRPRRIRRPPRCGIGHHIGD
ncbi:uncharacterized protein [Cicer arietinum]|uniref:uncharacterized protein n=1 Tax=Cicer arietinum TaxID=3827 RepID=UPI003CC6355D